MRSAGIVLVMSAAACASPNGPPPGDAAAPSDHADALASGSDARDAPAPPDEGTAFDARDDVTAPGDAGGDAASDAARDAAGDAGASAAISCVTTGTQYYVATSGDDAADGSAAHPWRTINHAAARAGAGATVHVASGTYTEKVSGRTSGTATARICFVSDARWGARLVGTDAGNAGAWEQSGGYVDIQGFDITGPGAMGVFVSGSSVRVIGNRIHDVPAAGCAAGAGILVYFGGNTGDEAIGNLVYNIGDYRTPCARLHGIYMASANGRVVNNVVYRTQGWGIHLWHEATGYTIANNTVFANAYGGILVGAGDCAAACTDDHTTVTNNIVFENGLLPGANGYGIEEYGATGTNNRFLNNLVFHNGPSDWCLQNGATHCVAGATGAASVSADPQFVRYAADGSGDYHLRAGSPAVDVGTTVGAPAYDFEGNARPRGAGFDLGAYESR